MGDEASNAFLKTLEEPPAQTIIILLTSQPQRLLTTILSRCLKISFGAAGRAATPYREAVAGLAARCGGRSVAEVYQLHAALLQLLQGIREKLRAEAEASLERYDDADPKVRERLEDQSAARVEGEYRAAREQVLEELYGWFGDVWLCVEQAAEELWEHPEKAAGVRAAAAGLTPASAAAQVEAIEQIREALTRNINETLAVEVGLLKLARPA
jgi:DNA polymerase-3 subunit delta'